MVSLRPYQKEAITSIKTEWQQGHKRTLLVLPTGTGKTICFGELARELADEGKRILILAHREELLDQAAQKIKAISGITCAVEKGKDRAYDSDAPITVGSVQTLMRDSRLDNYKGDYFNNVIIDEAHHSLAAGYKKIIEHFQTVELLGVTATPDRGDKKNLAEVYDSIAYEYSLPQAVKDGYLVPIKAQMIPLNIDLTSVKVSMGDYTDSSLGNALDPYLEQIAKEMSERVKDRKIVVFLPLIRTSQKFRDLLNQYGFKAAEVNGNSPDREQILKDFSDGKYNVLCNSMLLTEGWDCPSVDCIVCLRPTKVRALYAQMVGRGTRLFEGKDHLLLLDFLWMTGKHDLVRPAHLVAPTKDIADKMVEKADEEPMDIMEQMEQAEKDVVKEREQALARELAEQRKKKARQVDPLLYGVLLDSEEITDYVPTFGWEMEEPTEKQIKTLENSGICTDDIYCKGQATKLLDVVFKRSASGLASPKQMKLLDRYGFTNLPAWTKDAAAKVIGILASNNWQCPAWLVPGAYVPKGVNIEK